MKKHLFILVFLPVLAHAEGPLFRHKDTVEQQEFENVYQDLRQKANTSIVPSTTSYITNIGTAGAQGFNVQGGTFSVSSPFIPLAVLATQAAQFSQIKFFQIVISSTSSAATTTSTTFADTNLSASIAISSSTHKVLVLVSQSCGGILTAGTNAIEVAIRILRDSTVFEGATNVNYFTNLNASSEISYNTPIFSIDTPGSVATFTYKTQFARGGDSNAVTHQVQPHNERSWMVLIEFL